MTLADALAQLAADPDSVIEWLLVPAWACALLALLPAVARLLIGRGRYTDAIWGLSFLGIANRLTYILHVSAALSHLTALLTAVGVIGFAIWYQIHDAR